MTQRLYLLLGLVAILALMTLFSWLRDRKRDRIPTYTVGATVVSKRALSDTARSTCGASNILYYMIEFELEDGTMVELATSLENSYPDGTKGTLIFQRDRCKLFTPNEK